MNLLEFMKLNFKIFFFIFFFILPTKTILAKEIKEVYLIKLGPLNIGKLYWDMEIDNNNFNIYIKLKDRGVLSGLYRFEGDYNVFGKINNENFYPEHYSQIWSTKKKVRDIDIYFKKNVVNKLIIHPKETEKPRIKYIGLNNYVDPLTSFVNILMGAKQSKTFDGRRIYLMDANNMTGLTKKILIKNYINVWADHKRNDLKYIELNSGFSTKI